MGFKKGMTFWSIGDEVRIRLIPRGEKQTEMQFNAGMVWWLILESREITPTPNHSSIKLHFGLFFPSWN